MCNHAGNLHCQRQENILRAALKAAQSQQCILEDDLIITAGQPTTAFSTTALFSLCIHMQFTAQSEVGLRFQALQLLCRSV